MAIRLAAGAALCLAALALSSAAGAQTREVRTGGRATEVKLGIGHGIGFLPLYLAQDLKLFEKHAKGKPRISLQRFNNAAQLRSALEKGEITAAAFGLSGFLLARDAAFGTSKELVAISGITTLPVVLLTSRPDIKTLTDFKPSDRIAVPAQTSPQMTFLRLQGEKWFMWGAWSRLRQQVTIMPHQDALDAITSGNGDVAAYFASPPFVQIALRDPQVRPVLSSVEVTGGRASFFVLAAMKETLAANPALAGTVAKIMDEAADVIRKDPRRAAVTYLKYEPSHTLDARLVESILRELKDEFGSTLHGVADMAAYLRSDGRLKNPPLTWRDVVAPELAKSEGS